jgi:hypothetical protein
MTRRAERLAAGDQARGRVCRGSAKPLERKRVLVIGHVATKWGLEHAVNGVAVETLAETEFVWQEGWEYRLAGSGDR